MSQYFSRLAQRSGVSDAPASSALPAPSAPAAVMPSADTWSETATETVALGPPSTGGNWLPEAEDFAHPAPLRSLFGAPEAPDNAPTGEATGAGNLSTRTSANATPDDAPFLGHVRAVADQWRSDNMGRETVDTRPPAPYAGVPSAAAPASAPAAASAAASESASTDATASHATDNPHMSSVTVNTSSAAERVNARSPTPPAAAAARPPSSESSSVQIHIGRIELEVHAPAPTTPLPGPAAVPASPAPTRDTGFNRHRHYLRGR